SPTSLIQTIGRAARNVEARAILYADTMTKSMKAAIEETDRRREKQIAYNAVHGITPESVRKSIGDVLGSVYEQPDSAQPGLGEDGAQAPWLHNPSALRKHIEALRKKMRTAAGDLDFETAARLRDEIRRLETLELSVREGTIL
ncbi:MAG TPA: UvrB/UvrC motif-containing protein, partial [Alphaproteobacteria bacterium]|nr:UvrB/UvrC motif-containing protein [Alphaproteobacteria bacterium]